MQGYWAKTPTLIQRIFPKRIWRLPNNEKTVYLTFDDGPIPEVTPWVLETLKEFHAKATFFCIGHNIVKHPKVFKQILAEGHAIGNHTFHHLNGWKTQKNKYAQDILDAENIIAKHDYLDLKLFRPPYGKLSSNQSKDLLKKGYKIIMWDVLSADFDTGILKEQCLHNVLDHLSPGSIVVFHDSIKAEEKLHFVLPKVLQFIAEKGWNCQSIG